MAKPELVAASELDATAESLPISLLKSDDQEAAGLRKASQDIRIDEPVSVYTPAHAEFSAGLPSQEPTGQSALSVYSPDSGQISMPAAASSETTGSENAEGLPSPVGEFAASIYSPAHRQISVPAGASADDPSSVEPGAKDKLSIAALSSQRLEARATPGTLEPRSEGEVPVAPNPVADTTAQQADELLRPIDIAQSVPTDTVDSPDAREYDLTPVNLPRRTPSFNRFDNMKYSALYFLPGRLFFSSVTDSSLRLETNVYQTNSHYRPDMIYRILPNVTVGWALTRKTRVSANYFFLRDQYTKYNTGPPATLSRQFHSVGFQIDQDLYTRGGTNVTLGFLGRSLFISPDDFNDQYLNDLIPSLTVTRQVGYSGVVYGAVLGQIRFREFLSQFQEGDQFYSFGGVYRKGPWTALADFTLNSNFGNSNLRQGHNNQVIILTQEIARRVPRVRVPVDVYVRCQQIFNMGANANPGYAGVNTRVLGGARIYITKQPLFPVKLASN